MNRRLVFDRYGKPEEVLRVEEAPVPAVKEGELLVRMLRRPVNPYELALISGGDRQPGQPVVPGFEGVGIVEHVPDGAAIFRTGQRVIPTPVDLPGTWQDLVTGAPDKFIPVPDAISDTQACLIVNPLTCLAIIRDVLDIREGQWVLNTGASMNVGQLLVQFSRIFKFKLINVVRDRIAAEQMRAMGAEHIINTQKEDIMVITRHLTKGSGTSAVIDPVGGITGTQAAATLGFGGRMILFSDLSKQPVSVDPMLFISKKLTVSGYTSLHWLSGNSYERKAAFVGELFGLLADGSLELRADEAFALDDFAAAIRRSRSSGRPGKVILV
ncbi:zinc-dependent alcohol dehydrogenase family protein [Mucilaginibacter defluvii]|uniref:Enoyl reductase (ER) domain-containing protein n=1 Tax=Mucilaginibacter defluvii TaxID=1196019 RepID=A0ABP9FVI0_9SPHI